MTKRRNSFLSVDAIREVSCQTCGAASGAMCEALSHPSHTEGVRYSMSRVHASRVKSATAVAAEIAQTFEEALA